jgi:hypothetical protein
LLRVIVGGNSPALPGRAHPSLDLRFRVMSTSTVA